MSSDNNTVAIQSLLMNLESELRRLLLWQDNSPSAQALSSGEPFCVDTLTLPQWLQFVFIPRMNTLLISKAELPRNCDIAPMAKEFFLGSKLDIQILLKVLDNIDDNLSKK